MPHLVSKPHLPDRLLRKLRADPILTDYQSLIFSPTFQYIRLATNGSKAAERIGLLVLDHLPPYPGFRSLECISTVRTLLHLAANDGDPPLAYEMIRKGLEVDAGDFEGTTPLFLAAESARRVMMDIRGGSLSSKDVGIALRVLRRISFVARILIEHHADVNVSKAGVTPLHLFCSIKNWDVVQLLLEHGADPSTVWAGFGPPDRPSIERAQFLALVQSHSTGKPRPARLCPCLSGKSSENCHLPITGTTEYPPNWICRCGSGRTYRICCRRRGVLMVEKWDQQRQSLVAGHAVRFFAPSDTSVEFVGEEDDLNRSPVKMETPRDRPCMMPAAQPQPIYTGYMPWVEEQLNKLCSVGLLDPAFAYPIRKLEYIAEPWGRTHPKNRSKKMKEMWNACVDEYIALRLDQRSEEEIERAAKIGMLGGPLHRMCEAPGCAKLLGRDPSTQDLKVCPGCVLSNYCSTRCQKADSESHRAVCKTGDQPMQALRAQEVVHIGITEPLFQKFWKDRERERFHD